MTNQLLKFVQNKWAILLFCLILSLLLFSNTFQNNFVFDDVPTIRDNQILKNIQNIPQLFFSYYRHSPAGLYRPIQMISYSLNYFFFGEGVWSFHLVNIILHAFNCWLLFLLLGRLLNKKNLAYLTTLLFLVLPIHVEAVAGLVGRAELLALFFSFLTLLILIKNPGKKWAIPLAGFCFLLGLLSKEIAIAILPIYVFIRLNRQLNFKKCFYQFIGLIFAFGIYLTSRCLTLGSYFLVNNATVVENPLKFISAGTRILTAFKILTIYFGKIIFPLKLSSDYSFNQIPIVTNLGNLLSWLGIIVLTIFVYILLRQRKTTPALYLGSAIFICAFLPISNILTPIGTIMGERLMYFPSAGICLTISALLWRISQLRPKKIFFTIFLILFIGLIIFYIVRTWQRNYDWQSEKTLFLSAAQASPNSVLSRSNAGAIYLLEKNYQQAEKELLTANQIFPYYPHAVNNLGLVYRHQGEYKKAEEQFFKTLEISPNYNGAYENLGLVYLDWQKYPEAKRWLLKFFNDDENSVRKYIQQYFQMKINQALTQGNQELANQWLEKANQVLAEINQ